MAYPQGFEPRTHGLEGRCSILLSYGYILLERVKGIEPSQPAWEADALPLSNTRIAHSFIALLALSIQITFQLTIINYTSLKCIRQYLFDIFLLECNVSSSFRYLLILPLFHYRLYVIILYSLKCLL